MLKQLAQQLEGELHFDALLKTLYATDASVYRLLPLAVAFPKSNADIQKLIHFATQNGTSLIPRTAGTSLAGQCVGEGIVVDVSRFFTEIIEINTAQQFVRVQAGVIRDDLNFQLKKHGFFFAPNTSTSNRCMIGGMVGNNSCGSTSIRYGTTREHTISIKALLADGSEITFKALNVKELEQKKQGNSLEARIYQQLDSLLKKEENRTAIREGFPKKTVSRRNDGYALDALLESEIYTDLNQNSTKKETKETPEAFNLSKIICGSEGTLAFITEIKLNIVPLPPKHTAVVVAHFSGLNECMEAAQTAMRQNPEKLELMDDLILECTRQNELYNSWSWFVEGAPKGILMAELAANSEADLTQKCEQLIAAWKTAAQGYAFPILKKKEEQKKAWGVRKAGLGLLANIAGDPKAVAVVEDTAVAVDDLAAYIQDFNALLTKNKLSAVHYGHAGAGELHLRPILDLKQQKDRRLFREIGEETAQLVKKYAGSNSGEHGDGRVRGEFIPIILGEKNYELLREVKAAFDAKNIFNPGKIVDAPPMDADFRYKENQPTRQFETMLDFSETEGILRMAEKCNGTGECRKTHLQGGTMCPSYMATLEEKDSTRGRANVLREVLTRSNADNPFDDPLIKDAMDLCLSCKACASECPSNVDVARMKAEYQYQSHQKNGVPLRNRFFANINNFNAIGSFFPKLNNFFLSNKKTSSWLKKILGVAKQRSLPMLSPMSLRTWFFKHKNRLDADLKNPKGQVYFFADEFTNHLDAEIGIKAIELLYKLGYSVSIPRHMESGRAAMSKGLLGMAKNYATKNVNDLSEIVSEEIVLIGLEPSAILSFRDEYPRFFSEEMKEKAEQLAKNTFLIDEFLWREAEAGRIIENDFTEEKKQVKLHGHCHQKALSDVGASARILSLPKNYDVELIPSACCGMAGSFGYEEEHYEVSMQVGELVLFPAVRKADEKTLIVATGTSCRHQIADGTGRKALHPVEVLWAAAK